MPVNHNGQYHAYGKSSDDETKRKLLSKGVSREAIASHLQLQNMLELREDIKSERYTSEKKWVLFHPSASKDRDTYLKNVAHCDLIYQLFVKENILYGNAVYNASIHNINLGMNDKGTYVEDCFELPEPHMADAVQSVILAIDDLYAYPNTQPLDYQARVRQNTIERYLLHATRSLEYTIIAQSLVHPREMKYDWTDRFIKDLVQRSEIIPITAPKTKR